MLIRVKDLKKNYGDRTALSGISFQIEKGEIFGLLGPNGAGKTTTLKILTGQTFPSYGQIDIKGKNVQDKSLKKVIGVVPENTDMYERLTVQQNLSFFTRLYESKQSNIKKYLEEVGLFQERDRKIQDLSKGMKQRVLLIRALLHDPEILFLDEPTSGLDPSSADNIHRLLERLKKQGKTILLTSHNMEEVDKLCDRVAFLDRGEIVASGKPEQLKIDYGRRELSILYEEGNTTDKKTLPLSGSETADIVADLIRNNKIISIHSSEPTLADIFVKVTGRYFE
ncbi:MAG: ABC transporter ATP-binding protein [bacterium]